MITTIFIVVVVIITALFIAKNSEYYKENDSGPVRPIFTAIIVIAIYFFQPYTYTKVDAGYKGLKVKLTGSDRGVQQYEYKTGWVMYNSYTEQIIEFPMFQQHIEYKDQEVITKGGFIANIKPTFNYSLKEDKVGDMYVNLRLPVKDIEWGWLKTAIVGAVNDVANRWEVDKIFTNREEFENAVKAECNKRVGKWFDISQLMTNIKPPKAIQDAINSKTRAIQQAESEMQQAKTAQAEAMKKIAIARGDSAKAVIQASGEARANQLRQQTLSPLYIEYMKVQRWDGKLPSTTIGSGSGTILNLK